MNILFHDRDAQIVRFNAFRHVGLMSTQTFDPLADNIEAFIREIPAEKLERVCQNWTKRMDHFKRNRGQYLHEVIFKHLIIWTIDSNKEFLHFSVCVLF